MIYRPLGRSGLRASAVCLGTMGFLGNGAWGGPTVDWCSSREESGRIVGAFLDLGGNIIDTANSYGESEEWLGEFVGSRRDEVILSTKYGGTNSPTDVNGSGAHRKSLVRSVEASLRRLRTDHIDVLSLHCWDLLTPIEEVLRALDDLVCAGKVLYIGASNTPAWIVSFANAAADFRGRSRFLSFQAQYNLVDRDAEREILPMARALDVTVMAWTPLCGGWLTGKYRSDVERNGGAPRRLDDPIMGRFADRGERSTRIAAEVCRIAAEIERTPGQVALNWLRQQGIIPIVGARTEAQLRENLAATAFDLAPGHLKALTDVGKLPLGYPHDFLGSPMVRNFVYGKDWGSLVTPSTRARV